VKLEPFQRHGIQHLSPSSLNLFIGSPGLFVRRYLAKIKDCGKPPMWRGTAVDRGLGVLWLGRDMDTAIVHALDAYDREVGKAITEFDYQPNDATSEQRALIPAFMSAASWWNPPSQLLASQVKVEYMLDPIPVPIEGWVDYTFDDFDLELKTGKQIQTSITAPHARQVSMYKAKRNRVSCVLYATDKKYSFLPVTDDIYQSAMREVRQAAAALHTCLSNWDNAEHAVRSTFIDADHWQAPDRLTNADEIIQHIRG